MRRLYIEFPDDMVLALVERSSQTGVPLTHLVHAAVEVYLATPAWQADAMVRKQGDVGLSHPKKGR